MARGQGRDGVLATLARVDRTKAFLAALAVAVLALFLPGVFGAVLLYAVVAALGALLSLTWAVTPAGMRIFRLAVLAILAVIATTKLFG